jgi:RNA polymerase sigma-70 factor (ECF subfamily)
MDDDPVAAQLRAGDPAALAEFLERCRPRLAAYIAGQLGDALRAKVEPDDLVQEVNVEAVRTFGAFDLGDRDPFSWLCQVAQRRIIDTHRRLLGSQKRGGAREVRLEAPSTDTQHAGVIDLLVASMTTASQAFSRNQREHLLIQAMAKLSPEQRDVLRLRYVDGMPSKQIAAQLGKSDGAVRVMLTRSLKLLQELLGPLAAP